MPIVKYTDISILDTKLGYFLNLINTTVPILYQLFYLSRRDRSAGSGLSAFRTDSSELNWSTGTQLINWNYEVD